MAEALELLARNSFDLVISNIRMPQMVGFQFHAELCRSSPGTPLIFVSGAALDSAQQQLLAETGCRLLSKPLPVTELRRVVQEALGKEAEGGREGAQSAGER